MSNTYGVLDANNEYLGMVRPHNGRWRAIDDRGRPVIDRFDRNDFPNRSEAVDALCDAVDTPRAPIEHPVRLEN